MWRGALTAQITGGDPFSPRIRLLGDLGPEPARERARRRIETWLTAEAGRALRPLARLRRAIEDGALKGLARSVAFRLIEAGGVTGRAGLDRDLAALSQAERRALKPFAVRVGAFAVWLPAVLKPRALTLAQAFVPALPGPALPGQGLTRLSDPAPSERAPSERTLSAHGRLAAGRWTVPVETAERLAVLRAEGGGRLSDAALAELGWTESQAKEILTALRPTRRQQPDKPGPPVVLPRPDSPFAALADLTRPDTPARRAPRRRRRKAAARSDGRS